ncbi:MAG: ABC transporter substrate-binding protein [Desulfobulbus propionicus]|nr:MAG: ABC transporter substrate-binding protein [Desulfobulbus propionicus]
MRYIRASGFHCRKLINFGTNMLKYSYFFCVFLFLSVGIAGAEPAILRFAPLPMENREVLYKQFEPMRIYLQEVTGHEILFEYSDSYQVLIDKFMQGAIDLAYIGPLPYVELRKKYPDATPLLAFRETNGTAGYTCSIITIAENRPDLSNTEGLKVALTQPLSTCGYLAVNKLLKKHGSDLEKNHYRYLGHHDDVALAVVRSEYDIGGVKTAIAHKYEHLGLQILEETEVMPGFALVSNNTTVSPDLAEAIRNAFSSLQPAGKDKEMLAKWGKKISNGAVVTSDDQYDAIHRMLESNILPKKDHF